MLMRKFLLAGIALAVLGAVIFWIVTMPATIPASAMGPRTADLANGKEMFYAGGCASCHATPAQEDKTRLGGGLGLKSPYGTFYVPNISPDPNDGIGKWSEAEFASAMLRGTSPAGPRSFTALPCTAYQQMRIADETRMFAYL